MPKILVLASLADSLINFRGQLLKDIVSAGHQVLASAPSTQTDIQERLQQLGVPFQPIDFNRTGISAFADLRYLYRLRKLMNQFQPDIVFAYTIKPVVYGSLAAKLAKVPGMFSMITGLGYAFVEQESVRFRWLNKVVRFLYKQALRRNSAVFFQNPDDIKLFRDLGLIGKSVPSILLNGSGVDLHFFTTTALNTEPVAFLLIGRLIRDKGIFEYVEAAQKIRQRFPNTVFHLVGPFDSNPSAIKKLQVDSWVRDGTITYHGSVTDVRPFISASNVFVLPSYREGTPRSVLEAMAMGRPIITTDTPGCRETVVPWENGILIPARDSLALEKAMEKLILNRSLILSMGQNSRKIAEEKYDVRKVNRIILEAMQLTYEAPF